MSCQRFLLALLCLGLGGCVVYDDRPYYAYPRQSIYVAGWDSPRYRYDDGYRLHYRSYSAPRYYNPPRYYAAPRFIAPPPRYLPYRHEHHRREWRDDRRWHDAYERPRREWRHEGHRR